MTTDATPDLETRLQQWLSHAKDAWQHDNKWLRESLRLAAELLIASKDELTACRAEQARLREESNKQAAEADRYCSQWVDEKKRAERLDARLAEREVEIEILNISMAGAKDLTLIKEQLEVQVSTLTAALRRATDALGWLVNDRSRRPFGDFARAKEIMNECAAVLRAASEGA